MKYLFQEILDWLEVWALFIPLVILFITGKQPNYLKPVIIYLWLALLINLLANISWKFKAHYNLPEWYQSNTYFYNIHSIVRFFLLSWFFIKLKQPFLSNLKKIIPVLFFIFIVIKFIFFQDFFNFKVISSRLLALEAGLLLLYCLQYYLYLLKEEEPFFTQLPSFWVVTGLSTFVVVGFPIYLFYDAAVEQNKYFVINIWIVQKVAFLIFCLFNAKAFMKRNHD
jgi:hypothetical protein